tara:strand:+ start:81 stop:1043 length:963 start_codon:yes stop_codon:yes gene_type:complete
MKVVLIDYLSPIGHIPIINFYVKNLHNKFDNIYLQQNIKSKVSRKKKILFLKIKSSFIFRFFQILKLFKNFKKQDVKKIIMLSYEPYIILLLGLFMDLTHFKIFIFEHDTLNQTKVLKFFSIRLMNKEIIHLVYQNQQKKLLETKFQRKAILTNHPIIRGLTKKYLSHKKKIILIPTRHHFKKRLIELFVKQNPKFNFCILVKKSNFKKKLFSKFKNVKLKVFINKEYINKVDAIYLPLDPLVYKYRISSWVYMGIAYNKKIILENDYIYKFEKKRFPNHIILNKKDNINLKNSYSNNVKEINKYNDLLIKTLKTVLNVS